MENADLGKSNATEDRRADSAVQFGVYVKSPRH